VGDLNPYLALGARLLTRGHTVTVLANPYFESMVCAAGLPFVAMGTLAHVEDFWRDPDMWNFARHWKTSLRWSALAPMRDSYRLILERHEPGSTVVVGPGWAFGARIAQEKLGFPMVTIHLEPGQFRSVHQSPVMPPPLVLHDWVPRAVKRAEFWIADRWFIDPVLAGETNRFRKELGLPPVRRFVSEWWNSPDLVLGLFPEWFGPVQPDWPRQTALTGFPLWNQANAIDPPEGLARYLDEGDPPIVFTFGTVNRHTRRLFEASVDACRRRGCRGILITRHRADVPESLPAGVRSFEYIPFAHFLHRCAAIVHHGGTGTLAHALAAARPQVVIPLSFNQPDDAARLRRLGAAAVVSRRAASGRRIASALDTLLSSPAVAERCREMAARFEGIDAIGGSCDAIEALAARATAPRS
jgi:rhamnosyltransferase subunit B